jgi:hypothetical protein
MAPGTEAASTSAKGRTCHQPLPEHWTRTRTTLKSPPSKKNPNHCNRRTDALRPPRHEQPPAHFFAQQHSEPKDEDLEVLHIVDVCMCVCVCVVSVVCGSSSRIELVREFAEMRRGAENSTPHSSASERPQIETTTTSPYLQLDGTHPRLPRVKAQGSSSLGAARMPGSHAVPRFDATLPFCQSPAYLPARRFGIMDLTSTPPSPPPPSERNPATNRVGAFRDEGGRQDHRRHPLFPCPSWSRKSWHPAAAWGPETVLGRDVRLGPAGI